MSIPSRKSLLGTFALMASLSAPLVFAQTADVSAQTPPTTDAATQAQVDATTGSSESGVQGQAGTQDTGATSSATAAAPSKKSWADIDADKDGKLSKAEAAAMPALGQVFDQADGNGDGSLTGEEYKAYVAKVQGGVKGKDGGK